MSDNETTDGGNELNGPSAQLYLQRLIKEYANMKEKVRSIKRKNESLYFYRRRSVMVQEYVNGEEVCPVCMEDVTSLTFLAMKCMHSICLLCYEKMHSKMCPLCRAEI